ncbi:Acyl-CoA-binding protein, ACBP [Penicillium griseofulvum]|uniref:Acyl-CoA-binding protein, ACBP n=1 Tax=Penicillium patulum TaxID=5078 RepID=A0A135LYX3_PENPA|nr:Acyl-CoA-binding protein, ACBP [Penicillium griseofulvum]KXG54168.1 Acyl-CoA-binding protein, ACBP [Penicillium griseofulvum]
MSDITPFITVLEAAQKKEKFTPEVQEAAAGIDVAALKDIFAKVAEQGEFEKLDDATEAETLRKAFEFAAKAVMMLKTSPGLLEKKDLYIYFKVGKGDVMEKPGMFDIQKKQLYGAWEKVKDYSPAKAHQLYIDCVNTFITKYGTRDQ